MPARVQILEAQTRKFKLDDDVILREIAECLPDTVTGFVLIQCLKIFYSELSF